MFNQDYIMKKILGFFAAAILATSCLGIAGYEADYTTIVTFDYVDSDFIGDVTKPDSLLYDTNYKMGFVWDCLAFYHKIDGQTTEHVGGFAGSCLKVPANYEIKGAHDQYRANAKSMISTSNKYVVFRQGFEMPEKHLVFTEQSDATTIASCTMSHMYVTNSVAMEQTVRSTFVDGDVVTLIATGYNNAQMTGSAQINLAEYTAQKDSVITKWTKFDLSALGEVTHVQFVINANKYVPTTVCMDDIVARISISTK